MARKAIWSLFSTSKKPHSSSSSPHLLSLPSPHTPLSSLTWTLSDSMIQETIEDAQSAIAKWYPESLPLFHGNRAESVQFLNSIRQLDRAMRVLAASGPGSGSNPDRLVTAQNLMLTAMKRLERDFHMVLSSNLGGLDPESISSHYSSSSSSSESGGSLDGRTISEAAMYGLKLIADCMVASGYGRECAQVYKAVRRSIVHEGLNRLGIERLRTSHVQKMDARALDRTVKSWIGSVRTAVRSLFRGERILCDHVFSSSDSVRESCFKDITREAAVSLFHLPGLVVSAKRPPQGCCDRIHQLLDLYDALWEIWPDIETLFNFESTWDVRLQAIQSLVKLGGAIHGIISDYESGVQKETSKALAPGGGIHPLTSSAMDFLASLTRHAGTLSEILLNHSKPGGFSLPEEERSETLSGSALSLCLARVILTLLCKLDSKAWLYRDASLSYLFMANNLDYIVRKVGSTDLKYLLGEEWVSGKEKKVRQFATSYEVFAWGMVFLSLPETATSGGGGRGSISDDIVKEWFVKFNAAFEEAYVKQVSWVLPDRRLRELVKASLTNKILPAYRDLYELGIEWLGESNRFSGTVIRFTPDDVTSYLSELCRGDYSPPLLRDERVIDQCSTTDHFKTMRVDRDCQLC
ncbi:hypothetical protein SAY86_002665 [Trapa natans]|uniref:Exocyst subunit Exo70 family protein n=1 Tax=Trapa natans TaxID=22666 RepID=A0AAN7LU10_TRANT|nr:hypothetical protein SAY86_002665 [Trapa natans]